MHRAFRERMRMDAGPSRTADFGAYERLRRPRVEMIAGNAAATNKAKAGKSGDKPAMPGPEQMPGPVHRHHIDWDQPVLGDGHADR